METTDITMTELELEIGCINLIPAALFSGRYEELPDDIKSRLVDYLQTGKYPGVFLEGVLTNDLRKVINNSRDTEYTPWLVHLPLLVWWVYNRPPQLFTGDGYWAHLKK